MSEGASPSHAARITLAVRLTLGAALLGLTVWLVERWVGWGPLLAPWRELSPPALAAATALVLASYWVRALRLYDHLAAPARAGLTPCLRLTLLHNLLNNLVPMRLGEASFPALLYRYFHVPAVQGVATLLWFRITDLHVLAAAGWLALAPGLPPPLTTVVLAAWATLPWALYRARGPLARGLAQTEPSRWREWAVEALAAVPSDGPTFWRTFGWTLLNWLLKLAAFAWLLHAVAGTGPSPSLMGALAGELASVLPVHGLAGAGTYEAGVVAGLAPFRVEPRQALAAAVNLHLFLLGLSVLGGLWGLTLHRPHGPR